MESGISRSSQNKKSIEQFGLSERFENNKNLIITEPLDYFSFQKLVANCKFVITDSGGIQEETTFRQIPCLTLRENTERPSTIELGTNSLISFDLDMINKQINDIDSGKYKKGTIPPLWEGKATERIVEVLKKLL